MVDAEEREREENFSLESKVRRAESLIPDSLSGRGAAWMKNLSSTFIHARLLRPCLPRAAALFCIPTQRRKMFLYRTVAD